MAFDTATLASQYGFSQAFFSIDPELKALLDQAVKEQWTPDKFRAKFINTNWYRVNSQSYKNWVELKTRNPGEAQAQIDQMKLKIQNMATMMGANPVNLEAFAEQALWSNWNDDQIKQVLTNYGNYTDKGAAGTGEAGQVDARIRQLSNDYGITISDGEINKMTRQFLQGAIDDNGLQSYAKNMAMSKYAGMRGFLSEGFTVRQVADPYIQSYSKLLEQSPDTVQLSDPLIQKALQGTQDPKTGIPQMQSLYQFEQSVRQDKRWLGTQNAHDQVENVALQVARDWGIHG